MDFLVQPESLCAPPFVVRDGKGQKDRVTVLPDSLMEPLQNHLRHVEMIHRKDLAKGYGAIYLPNALERKYPTPTEKGCGNILSLPNVSQLIPAPA